MSTSEDEFLRIHVAETYLFNGQICKDKYDFYQAMISYYLPKEFTPEFRTSLNLALRNNFRELEVIIDTIRDLQSSPMSIQKTKEGLQKEKER